MLQLPTFFSNTNLSTMWGYVETLLKFIAPGVMIPFAIVCVGLLLGVVIRAWKQAGKEQEEEDYEVKHY